MSGDLLHLALTDPGDDLNLLLLPEQVDALLRALAVPPRLAAHLRLVHDVAHQVGDALEQRCPGLTFDRSAVEYGAATHDIGKVQHLNELTGPGSAHEPAGRALLLARGVPDRLARFAATHASWTASGITIEDLLVSLADKIWKAARVADLETLIVERCATASGTARWQVYLDLDDIIQPIADNAGKRLAYQSSHRVERLPLDTA